uniref:Uncharacterized protein n=1 Tax=Arundo donax TaxID=35708 RepID=A0A0A9AHP4_ARUDO
MTGPSSLKYLLTRALRKTMSNPYFDL